MSRGKDDDILDLYFARDERAIRETDRRYGRSAHRAFNGCNAPTATSK